MNDEPVHGDPEILAMMAMGEPDIPLTDELHVQDCPHCLDELNSLVRVTTLARSGSPLEHPLDTPGPAVWRSISHSLGLATDVVPGPFETGASHAASDPAASPLPVAMSSPAVSSPRGHRAHRPAAGWSRWCWRERSRSPRQPGPSSSLPMPSLRRPSSRSRPSWPRPA